MREYANLIHRFEFFSAAALQCLAALEVTIFAESSAHDTL
jgi:hypothetical protein